jgi:hypothetical protein
VHTDHYIHSEPIHALTSEGHSHPLATFAALADQCAPNLFTRVYLCCARLVYPVYAPFPVCYRSGLRAHHRTCVAETLHTTSSPPPVHRLPPPHHTHTQTRYLLCGATLVCVCASLVCPNCDFLYRLPVLHWHWHTPSCAVVQWLRMWLS